MLKRAARSTLVILFLLSMLTWFHPQFLLAWELSIVTTQLGQWLALLTAAAILLSGRPRGRAWLYSLLGVFALITFLSPLMATVVDHPGQISFTKLFELNEAKTPFQRFTFTAANDRTPLNLDFYPPTENIKSPSPWVLVVHGGGWINGDSEQLPELNYHLNRLGYAVISVDYRLSPGWLWPAPKDDVMRALEFIRAHAGEWKIDPDRWVALGRSAGAQIAGVTAYSLRGTAKPKGFISFYGPADLVFGYDVGAEEDILRSRTLLRGFLGGPPDVANPSYLSASVVNAITPEGCPALLIHGREDILVYYKHTERLIKVLEANKIAYDAVWMRFGPHGFDFFFNGPEAQVSTAAVDQFFAKVLPNAL